MKGIKYIYNIYKADEIMKMGIKCRGTGFNAKSQKIFWAFDYNEVQAYYDAREKQENI